MTLQQQVIKEAGFLSEEELLQVIQFMNFLRYNKSQRVSVMVEQKKKKYRERGCLSGQVKISDDFNGTPECFKEYI